MILKLSVNNQSVESSGITKDYKDALCEYVWNSFEANATAVAIDCVPNELSGSAEIIITDNGDGISYGSLAQTFGAFLDSQKNSRSLQIKTKANKGKGRFSCFSFASFAEWSTVTATPEGNIAYTISLENADKNQCDVSNPEPTTRPTGTRLIISGIDGIYEDDVSFAQLEDTMLKAFAWYLYLNKDKKIALTINGEQLDYQKYINTDASIEREIQISRIPFKIALIVWNEKISENFSIYFLDEEGVVRSKDTTTFNRNTVNFNHSVFVTSPFFLGRDGITLKGKKVEVDGQTALNEYEEDKKVLKELLYREPALIIMKPHPKEFKFTEDEFFALIPFATLEKIYLDENELVQDIVALAVDGSTKLMDKLMVSEHKPGFFKRLGNAFILQPNFTGVGVDLKVLFRSNNVKCDYFIHGNNNL